MIVLYVRVRVIFQQIKPFIPIHIKYLFVKSLLLVALHPVTLLNCMIINMVMNDEDEKREE